MQIRLYGLDYYYRQLIKDDTMNNEQRDELLLDIHGKLSMYGELVERHDKALFGNGRPGLLERFNKHETVLKTRATIALGIITLIGVVTPWVLYILNKGQ